MLAKILSHFPIRFWVLMAEIVLSLAKVVVASLMGAKGLGEDVLKALHYANAGCKPLI